MRIRTLEDLIFILTDLVSALVPVLFALAFLAFFWGLATFILNAGNEEGRTKGKTTLVWGSISLFVIFSIWGILTLLKNTFFLSYV